MLEATGIAKVAKWALGEDCGCEERKEKLNKLFPYHKSECLTEEEFTYLDKYYKEIKDVVHPNVQLKMVNIYNRVFHQKVKLTSCGSCYKRTIHASLNRIYKEYNK